jgi:outer membrane beta-barrel protein
VLSAYVRRAAWGVGLALMLFGAPGWAQTAPPADKPAKARRPSDEPPPPSCLDRSIIDELGQSLRPRGVQKKDFLKRRRFEVVAHGGLYASDLLSSTYLYGGGLTWYPFEDLGVEASFDVMPVALDLDEPVADFFGDPHFQTSTGYLGMVSVLWAPIHYKVKTSGGSILHGDIMFALGGGKLFHDTTQGVAVGGGIVFELYLARWLSLRLDVRDHLMVQEAVAETRLTNNITALLGVGIWVPFGF